MTGAMTSPVPRVLVVVPEQWPRALLRAELREAGYDAVGARDLADALAYPARISGRGPVRLVIVDQGALRGEGRASFDRLLERHGSPPAVLVAPAGRAPSPGPWQGVLRRPVSIAALVRTARELVPLPPEGRQPVDER